MRITLIYNAAAGGEGQPSCDELVGLIHGAGHKVIDRSSKDDDWDRALRKPADLIAVAGGDGTVGKIAKRLIGRRTPVAVLPLGTANNIAKTLGLADNTSEQLVAGWRKARRVKFDIGVARGPWGSSYFIEGVGAGLFTDIVSWLRQDNRDLIDSDNTATRIASVLQLLKNRLQSCPVNKLKMTLDRQEISAEYILLEIMNIKHVGPTLFLAPDADPGDGLLDIVFAAESDRETLSRYLSDSIEGRPSSASFTVHRGRKLQIEWDGFPIHIDDKLWPAKPSTLPLAPVPIEITLRGHAVEFLSPR